MQTLRMKFIYSTIVLAAVSIGITSCQRSDNTAVGKETTEKQVVTTMPAAVEPITATLRSTGTLEGIREALVMSETQGRITSIAASNGSRIGAGGAIVTVDNELKAIAVAQAEAARMAAEAAFEKAQLDHKRAEALAKDNALAKSQLEMSALGVKSAEAQLKAAQSAEALAKRQLADATVKAPFAGVVAMRYVNQGELLAPGARVAQIVDDSKMKLKVNISELEVPMIKVGDKAEITVDAAVGKTFTGTITSIGAKADMARAYMVEIEIPNTNGHLKSGMFARALIVRESARNALVVPSSAVISSNNKSQVFLVKNGKAKLTAVKTGIVNGERIEVLEGIAAGDSIVTFGQTMLKDGALVTVTRQ